MSSQAPVTTKTTSVYGAEHQRDVDTASENSSSMKLEGKFMGDLEILESNTPTKYRQGSVVCEVIRRIPMAERKVREQDLWFHRCLCRLQRVQSSLTAK